MVTNAFISMLDVYCGYAGKIVEVNLSIRKTVKKNTDRKIARKFIGGLGFSSKILYDEVGRDIDPFGPDNFVIIAPGVLTGTTAPTAGRTEVTTKSPLTGIMGTGNFGGFWGSRLKQAGYDLVVITGASNKPVYLWIDDDSVTVENAEHLWGKDSWETTDVLMEELGEDISVMSIGQAGENLVRFACPVVDYHHAAGRSNAGCVMGAKRLKAIAVRGTGQIAIASPEKFEKVAEEIVDRIWSYPDHESVTSNIYYFARDLAEAGHFGCRNYQTTILSRSSDISASIDSLKSKITIGPEYGYNCPLEPYYGCNIMADIKKGKYAGLKLPGIIYTLPYTTYGAKCGIENHAAMWKCRELCQRYGMDENGPIPFALELFQRGIITKEDTDGLELKWGDEEAIMKLMRQIAYREGFGNILAEGSVRAATNIGRGARKYVMAIKNMEIQTTVDPRVLPLSTNLGYLTSVRGADDLKSTHTIVEKLPRWAKKMRMSEKEYLRWFLNRLDMPVDLKKKVFGDPPRLKALSLKSKAAITKWYGDISCIFNSLGICLFAVNKYSAIGISLSTKLYTACTGTHISSLGLINAGERIFNLMKAYATRQGLARKDDNWPSRFYEEPLQDGPLKGAILSKQRINRLLNEYYGLRGWNKERGTPTKEQLIRLGLDYVADELVSLGYI